MKHAILLLYYLMMLGALDAQPKTNTLYFSVHLERSLQRDTLTLKYWPYVLDDAVNESLPHQVQSVTIDKEGNYVFKMEGIQKPGYISLATGVDNHLGDNYYWLQYYYAEPGDSIHADIQGDSTYITRVDVLPQKFNMVFTGMRYEKYQCRNSIDKTSFGSNDRLADSAKRSILLSYKNKLSPLAYQVIQADMIGNEEYQKLRQASYGIWKYYDANKDSSKIAFHNYKQGISKDIFGSMIPDTIKAFSNAYSKFLFDYSQMDYRIGAKDTDSGNVGFYQYLKCKFKGPLRDRLITMFFLLNGGFSNEDRKLVKDATTIMKSEAFIKRLKQLMEEHPGNDAYNFSLPDTSGRIVHLSDFRGKAIFIDFWHTGCGPCLGYYQHVLKYAEEKLKDRKDVVFITISVDQHKNEWMASIRNKKYTSPAVVNLFTDGLGVNHSVIQMYNISGFPSPLIINRKGEIYKFLDSDLYEIQTLIKAINEAAKS